MVSALTATWIGSCSDASRSRSIITDVSSNPRSGRGSSATRCYVLAGDGVEVDPETLVVDRRCRLEQCHCRLGGHEAVATQRRQLSHRDAIASHDERLTLVEFAHDLPAVIAQLPLADLSTHRHRL